MLNSLKHNMITYKGNRHCNWLHLSK